MGSLCSKGSDAAVVNKNADLRAKPDNDCNRATMVEKMSMKDRLAARDALEAQRKGKVVEELNELKFISYDEEMVAPPPVGMRLVPLDRPTTPNNEVRSQELSQAPPSGVLEPLPSEPDVYPIPFDPEVKVEEEVETKIFDASDRVLSSDSPPPEPCASVGDQATLHAQEENPSPPTVQVLTEKSASSPCELPDGVLMAHVPPTLDTEEEGSPSHGREDRENTSADVLPSSPSSHLLPSSVPLEDVDAPSAEMAVLLQEKTALGSSSASSGRASELDFSANAPPVVEGEREVSTTNPQNEEDNRWNEGEEMENTKEPDADPAVVDAPLSPVVTPESPEEMVDSPAGHHWDPQDTEASPQKKEDEEEEEEEGSLQSTEKGESITRQEKMEVVADEQEEDEGTKRSENGENHPGVLPSAAEEVDVRPSSADDLDPHASSLISLPEEAEGDDVEEFPFSPPFAPVETGEAEEVHRQGWERSAPVDEIVPGEDAEVPEPVSSMDPPSPLLVHEDTTEGNEFFVDGEQERSDEKFDNQQEEGVSRKVERSPSPSSVPPPEEPLEALPKEAPHGRGPVLPPSPSPASEAAADPSSFFSHRNQWNLGYEESRLEDTPQEYVGTPPAVDSPLPRRQPPPLPSLSSEDE